MNRYPLWKYVTIVVALLIALLYALPNLYGEAPGVQVSSGQHGVRIDAGVFNLTNADYIEWADVRGRAVDDPLVPYYTRPGRNASITLHWAF